MKLELKHIAPYLPYELPIEPLYKSMGHMGGYNQRELSIDILDKYELEDIKPILRPLSDLTKEIEVNGEKFYPASKMITHGFHNPFWYEVDMFNYKYLFAYDLEKLLEWHFDVFGLIPQGLAIDVNTLSND
jgi:hypothetical protein